MHGAFGKPERFQSRTHDLMKLLQMRGKLLRAAENQPPGHSRQWGNAATGKGVHRGKGERVGSAAQRSPLDASCANVAEG